MAARTDVDHLFHRSPAASFTVFFRAGGLAVVRLFVGAAIAFLGLMAGAGQAAEVKVIAANAVKEGYAEIVAAFEKSSGHKVVTTWAGTVATEKRVGAGELFDVVLIGSD